MNKIIIVMLLLFILASVNYVSAFPFSSDDTKVDLALQWLHSQQDPSTGAIGSFAVSSWAAMAIAASEEDPNDWTNGGDSIIDYLKKNTDLLNKSNKSLDYSRFILSMVAAGEDPTNVNSIDLVAELDLFYDDSQFDDPTLLNDDCWAVMALTSAGIDKNDEKIQNSIAFIKANQNEGDHGWSYGVGADSDVDSTAAAIMALISAGESPTSTYILDGLSYIKSKQTSSGGFDSWGFGTSAESDAWAIQAIIAAEQNSTGDGWTKNDNTPIDDLLSFQNSDGSFNDFNSAPNSWTTSYAIPALLGKPYPIIKGAKIDVRLEGQYTTLWKGEVFVSWSKITGSIPPPESIHYYGEPTIIGALDVASRNAGFEYVVDYTWGSAYVAEIDGEAPSGMNGWLFRVNDFTTGSYSADGFILNEATTPSPPHNSILWYYGGMYDKVLQISVDRTNINPGESFAVSVSYLDPANESGTWLPLEEAIVYADSNYLTNSNGQATISLSNSGTYDIFAEKDGHVRSDKIQVTVSASSEDDSNLEAEIIPALSLEVTPHSIDFGTLGPGMTSSQIQLDIENGGSIDARVSVTVTDIDGTIFQDTLQLRKDGTTWGPWTAYEDFVEGHDGNQPGRTNSYTRMNIPTDYPVSPGHVTGKITFWIEPS